jgi:hypothetical protein
MVYICFMDKPFYEFTILDDAFRFEFTSIGKNKIEKVVIFQKTNLKSYYNLVLSDLLPDGTIYVFAVSNNGDLEKIIATVGQTIIAFLAYNPDAYVAFSGSTPARTRMYNIILTKEFSNLGKYNLVGLRNLELVPFETNQIYEAFVISIKK